MLKMFQLKIYFIFLLFQLTCCQNFGAEKSTMCHYIQHCGIDKELNNPLGIQPVWALFTEVNTKVWVAAAVEVTVL